MPGRKDFALLLQSTGFCVLEVRGSGPKGVGGRMADSLSQTQNLRTMSFSLNGRQTWAQGSYTSQVGVPVTGEVPTTLGDVYVSARVSTPPARCSRVPPARIQAPELYGEATTPG